MNYWKLIFLFFIFTISYSAWANQAAVMCDTLPLQTSDSIFWKRYGDLYDRDTLYGGTTSLPKRFSIDNSNKRFTSAKGVYYNLPDSSHLWIISDEKHWKCHNREVSLFIPKFDSLEFYLLYTDSLLIKNIFINHIKTEYNGTIVDGSLRMVFKDGTSFSEGGQVFTVQDFGYFEIYFHPNNQMRSFAFYPFTKDHQSYQIEFRTDLTIKSYGFLEGNCPVGTWFFYDEFGLIEKITENAIVDRKHIEKIVFERKK